MNQKNKDTLNQTSPQTPPKLSTYLTTTETRWYWVTIFLAAATALTVFTIPENSNPLIYVRYVLGAIFVLFLPGYSLIKAIFPGKELDTIERTALSLGLSLAIVPLTGLILNYTPWGIRTTPITLILMILTIILATTALIREHQTRKTELMTRKQTPDTSHNLTISRND